MSQFFKTLNISFLEPIARMRVNKIPYSSITCEDDYYTLEGVYNTKWIAEHMSSHYCCAAYVEALTGKEYPEKRKAWILASLEESEELSGPYLEKVNSGVLPSLAESFALRAALSGPHLRIHQWCIDAVK